jgi:hypothetical protein
MGYKINIRNAANDGWVNLLQAEYVEVLDSNGYFDDDNVEGALAQLHSHKAPRIENTVNPTSSDDSHQTGAIWINTSSDEAFICVDNTASNAVWVSVSTYLTQEQVEDYVGVMVTGNTENGISVTYDDVNGKLDFDVNDPTITLSGDVNGSATMTDLGNVTITTTISGDYYNQQESDDRFVNVTGDTMTGPLAVNSTFSVSAGHSINEISTDGTLAGNSDNAVPTEQAVKTYIDSRVSGLDWQESVIDKDLDAPPGSPSTGDRYIVSQGPPTATGDWTGHDNEFAEWDGSQWVFTTITEGAATWVEDEDVVYVWNGSTWAKIGTTVTHNNLNGLQGGNGSDEYFHLTSAEHTSITGSKTQNTVFAAPNGSTGVGSFRTLVSDDIPILTSTKISDFKYAAQDAYGALVTAGTQDNITVTYDDVNNKVDFSVNIGVAASASDVVNAGLVSFDNTQFTVDGNGFVQFAGGSDHGALLGLSDDDHSQYVHISNARVISVQHTYKLFDTQPFVEIDGGAKDQWVQYLNADMVDGHHWGSSTTADEPTTTLTNDIWVEVTSSVVS